MSEWQVILADPPWKYGAWTGKKSRTADSHYHVLPTQTIGALPVPSVSPENAVLFLWATPPMMSDARWVMHRWGFQYKTFAFVWVKMTKGGKIHTGMGHYTRANAEVCLLGIRGKMPVHDHSVQQVILAERREHSRKPDEQYKRIETLYPGYKKLEIFARHPQPEWSYWGEGLLSEGITVFDDWVTECKSLGWI